MHTYVLPKSRYYSIKYETMKTIKENFRCLEHGTQNSLFCGFTYIEMFYNIIYNSDDSNTNEMNTIYDKIVKLLDLHIDICNDIVLGYSNEVLNPNKIWVIIIQNVKVLNSDKFKTPTVAYVHSATEYEAYLSVMNCHNIDKLFIGQDFIESKGFTKHLYIIKNIFPIRNSNYLGLDSRHFEEYNVLIDNDPETFLKYLKHYNLKINLECSSEI